MLGQRRLGHTGARLVRQPRRRRPGQGRRELQHRGLHDHDPGAAPGRRPAAHPAGPAARRQGPRHRPDEPRPAVHGRVRQRRVPGRHPRRARGQAQGAVLRGRDGGGDLGRRDGRGAVLEQHAGALVPQVVRREGRPRHDQAGHLGPDHRRGRGERRQGRGPGQQVRGLLGLDQRPDRGRRRRDRHRHRQGGRRQRSRSTPSRARRPPRSSRSWRTRRPLPRTCRSPTRAPPGRPSAPTRGRSWSTGPTSGPTTTRRSPR